MTKKITNIQIKDLEINEELDKQAMKNLIGGRWGYRWAWKTKRVRYRVRQRYWIKDRRISMPPALPQITIKWPRSSSGMPPSIPTITTVVK